MLSANGSSSVLIDRLGWAGGVAWDESRAAWLVSESWSHRVVSVKATGDLYEVVSNLPRIPGRNRALAGRWFLGSDVCAS